MKCIIVEDELPAQRILKNYIKRIPDLQLLSSFQTALSANNFLKENSVDIVLLDINLPDISGLDFIKSVKKAPQIIITTAYPDFAVSSFELETIVDYLVKPFSFDRFLKAMAKAETFVQRQELPSKHSVLINIDKTVHKIQLDTIQYIASDRNYVTLFTTEKKLTFTDSLKNWKESLPLSQFVQIHKSYIVNLQWIQKYTGTTVFIENTKLPIGRTYKAIFTDRLKNYSDL